ARERCTGVAARTGMTPSGAPRHARGERGAGRGGARAPPGRGRRVASPCLTPPPGAAPPPPPPRGGGRAPEGGGGARRAPPPRPSPTSGEGDDTRLKNERTTSAAGRTGHRGTAGQGPAGAGAGVLRRRAGGAGAAR